MREKLTQVPDVDEFLDILGILGRAKGTLEANNRILILFFEYAKKKSAIDVTVDDVDGFLENRMGKVKPSTYFMEHSIIRKFFQRYNPDVYEHLRKIRPQSPKIQGKKRCLYLSTLTWKNNLEIKSPKDIQSTPMAN